jgi:hypothetical protein
MKKSNILFGLCILLSSCVKEISNSAITENSGTNSLALQPSMHNGALMGAGNDIPAKIDILNNLGVNYERYTIIMTQWKGSDGGFEQFARSGFHQICNINYDVQPLAGQKPIPFAKDTVSYKNELDEILTKYQPELAVIENEETNKLYYAGSMSQYLPLLRNAVSVAHSKGVKVTDGGIHPQGICYFVWKDYKDRGMDKEADDWMTLTFNTGMRYQALHPEKNGNYNYYWRQIDTLLNAFTTMDVDYVNSHIYEPINNMGDGVNTLPGCIKTMADYIKRRTGKQLITNECGQRNTNANLVSSMLQAFKDGEYPYVMWFSRDGAATKGLTEANGVLRTNGTAYKNFVTTH